MDDLWRIAAEDQAGKAGNDAKAACMTIAAVAKAMHESFTDEGFSHEESFALLMVLWENGAIQDA